MKLTHWHLMQGEKKNKMTTIRALCMCLLLLVEKSTGVQVTEVEDIFCDVYESSSCQTVSFYGTGFDPADGYQCNITSYEFNTDEALMGVTSDTSGENYFTATTTVSVPATYISEEQIDCHLPSESGAAAVTLTSQEHGDLETGKVIIFPMTCFSCDSDFSCTVTDDGCYIDEQCYEPYTFLDSEATEICLPELDQSGPSPIQEPDTLDVKADSCGSSSGIEIVPAEGGFTSEGSHLAAASFKFNMTFLARLECDPGHSDEITIAEFPPAIKIYQIGKKVFIDLRFFNFATAEQEKDIVEYDLMTKELQFKQRRVSNANNNQDSLTFAQAKCFANLSSRFQGLISRWLKYLQGQCGLAVALRHNVNTAQTELFINNHKILHRLGSTAGLQLLMTRPLFFNSSHLSCSEIHNSEQDMCSSASSTRDDCFTLVSKNRECPT